MIDGMDVLFRIAFGILRTNEQELLRCTSIPAVYVALESLPNRMWEADRLLQVCLCRPPSTSQGLISFYTDRAGVAEYDRPF